MHGCVVIVYAVFAMLASSLRQVCRLCPMFEYAIYHCPPINEYQYHTFLSYHNDFHLLILILILHSPFYPMGPFSARPPVRRVAIVDEIIFPVS